MSDPNPSFPVARLLPLRAACAATLVAGGLIGGLAAGCDRADPNTEEALANLREATTYRTANVEAERYTSAAAAASDSEGSDAVQAVVAEFNGDIAMQQAEELMGRRASEEQEGGLIITQSDALREAFGLSQVANTVALAQTFIESERQNNPQPTLELIDEKIERVQAGEGWSPAESVEEQLMTIAQVDEQIEALEAEVQSLQETAATLEQQQSEALSQASELDAEVGMQEPDQAEQTDQQIRELRDEAADLAAQATLNDAEIERLETQIRELEALRAVLVSTVEALEAQSQTLTESWTEVSAQIEDLEARMRQIYAGPAPSVNAAGEALAEILERLSSQEEEALSLLDRAVTEFGNARSKATQAVGNRRQAWDEAFRQAIDQRRHALQLAIAKRRQASVHVGSAAVHLAVLRAQRTLEAGGLDLPPSLGGDPGQAFADALQQAAEALTEAQDDAEAAAAAQGPAGRAAILQQALVLTDMITLHHLAADAEMDASLDLPPEQELYEQLRQVVSAGQEAGVRFPRLPALVAAGATRGPAPDQGGMGGGIGGGGIGGTPGQETQQPDDEGEPEGGLEGGPEGQQPEEGTGQVPEDMPGDEPAPEPGMDPGLEPAPDPGLDPGLDPGNADEPG